ARLALHAMPLSVLLVRRPRSSPLFPYTTLFRSPGDVTRLIRASRQDQAMREEATRAQAPVDHASADRIRQVVGELAEQLGWSEEDRKSTRLNSSHVKISYAVFCLKKKNARKSTR